MKNYSKFLSGLFKKNPNFLDFLHSEDADIYLTLAKIAGVDEALRCAALNYIDMQSCRVDVTLN